MKKVKLYWDLYYPIILKICIIPLSVSLWFSGQKLEEYSLKYSASILNMSVAIRQRRNDLFREQAAKEEDFITLKEKENDEFTGTFRDVYYWFIIFKLYLWIINYDISRT